jgi:predicted PurR-regulated permease PerM
MEPILYRNGAASRDSRAACAVRCIGGRGLTVRWLHTALIVVLSAWVLHSFLEPLLVACVTAIASWPLYTRFAASLPRRVPRSAVALIFTLVMALFVLAPLVFAFGALLAESSAVLRQIAASDTHGIAVPQWLGNWPWLTALWERQLAHPGALQAWMQQADNAALLGVAQSIGQFMARHVLIIFFTILVLVFLYQEGESLAEALRRLLRQRIGERAEAHIDVATRSLRASVNSMLVVGLFDGFATALVYAIAGVPHPMLWAAITGALALIPFLGYAAVAALALQLSMTSAASPVLLAVGLGCIVLFCGDKVVRPLVAADGTHLGFVWVLMGCLGGFEVLGLVGLVIGPVLLTLTRELWEERVRDLGHSDGTDPTSVADRAA